jgi:putative sugar O-methyltransferase
MVSEAFVDRLKNSYRLQKHENPDSPVWTQITSMNEDIHQALLADNKSLSEILNNPVKSNLYYGVDNLARGVVGLDPEIHQTHTHELFIAQLLEKLGVSAGVSREFNPEASKPVNEHPRATVFEKNLNHIELVLDKLENKLGITLKFDNPFRGEIGLRTSRGIISTRSVHALFYAIRFKELSHLVRNAKVLEIGPGMGRVLKLLHEMNVPVVGVDLPLGCVGSALFLAETLGENRIQLWGEPSSSSRKIRLVPAQEFWNLEDEFGLVLNTDSLTEMSRKVARDYIEYLDTRLELFYSVNHESNEFTVSDLFESSLSYHRISRMPFPLREGYLEEVFIPRQKVKV